MESNHNHKFFLVSISFFLVLLSCIIYPQKLRDRTELNNNPRTPAANNSNTTSIQQRPSNTTPSINEQKLSQNKQVQRPDRNDHPTQAERNRQIVNVQRDKINKREESQRTNTIPRNPSVRQKKDAIDIESSRKPSEDNPVREERVITQPEAIQIQHNPPYEEYYSDVDYYDPTCNDPRGRDGIYLPLIQIEEPVHNYRPSLPRPINKMSLKEQAIKDYYDEYYFDALIDLNAAINKDSLDFELYFWRGMVWFKLTEYESSVTDFSKYLKYYDDAEAYFHRGLANLFLINKLEAFHDLQKADELGYPKAADILDKYFKDYHM